MVGDVIGEAFRHGSVIHCPRCGGCGTGCDGSGSIGPKPEDARWNPPSKCLMCDGSGRVRITPVRK